LLNPKITFFFYVTEEEDEEDKPQETRISCENLIMPNKLKFLLTEFFRPNEVGLSGKNLFMYEKNHLSLFALPLLKWSDRQTSDSIYVEEVG
jgi:hypothetical protein